MQKRLFALTISLALFLSLFGCQKDPEPTEGALYAKSLGWYDEMTDAFSIATKAQVDALQPGVGFPNVTLRRNGVTVTVLQTIANAEQLYFLVRTVIDEDVSFTGDDPTTQLYVALHQAGETPYMQGLTRIYPGDARNRENQREYTALYRVNDISLASGTVVSITSDHMVGSGQKEVPPGFSDLYARLTWTPHWGDIDLSDGPR